MHAYWLNNVNTLTACSRLLFLFLSNHDFHTQWYQYTWLNTHTCWLAGIIIKNTLSVVDYLR